MLLNVQMSRIVACTFIPSLSMTGWYYPSDIRGVEKIRAKFVQGTDFVGAGAGIYSHPAGLVTRLRG